MLYLLLNQTGWLAFFVLLIIAVVLLSRIQQQLTQLRRDVSQLQQELAQQQYHLTLNNSSDASTEPLANSWPKPSNQPPLELSDTASHPAASPIQPQRDSEFTPHTATSSPDNSFQPPPSPDYADQAAFTDSTAHMTATSNSTPHTNDQSPIEPDEHSLPIVTSLFYSLKNWFTGGNLVVRVGVGVLLVGVVLLLRLLSDYLHIPISVKLGAIGVIGLALAGLGLKLAKKRFAYGITLEGAGLAIAYLSTFFAYRVYHVLASLPSFVTLGILSAITVGLAVRQNAFPLALLAFSGAFFAPILTGTDTGSLVALFGYYLLLNVAIAVIAHYRTWKVLNLLGATMTFGFAYYLGATENLSGVIETQRWPLVALVALHLALYLFVVIRYAQQIIAYNSANQNNSPKLPLSRSLYVFPIDTGLLFSVPILAFGLLSFLLNGIEHALTLTSAILATIYLSLSWLFIQRSQRYSLITEGMLALGLGFLALVIPLAFEAEWIASGWSVQGLALVWFGRRSLRAWSVLFGLILQTISVWLLIDRQDLLFAVTDRQYATLALTMSALGWLGSMYLLRGNNSPETAIHTSKIIQEADTDHRSVIDNIDKISWKQGALINTRKSLGLTCAAEQHSAEQWLSSIAHRNVAYSMVWCAPRLINLLTVATTFWTFWVLTLDLYKWLSNLSIATSTLMALATLITLILYWVSNRLSTWSEVRRISHALLLWFYLLLVIQLPQKFEFGPQWLSLHWWIFAALIIGWLFLGQLWLKTWHSHRELMRYDSSCWLSAGILILAGAIHYGLPDSDGVMAILIPVAVMLIGLWLSYRTLNKYAPNNLNPAADSQAQFDPQSQPLPWFDWQQALLNSSKFFLPLTLLWVVLSNWWFDGVVWDIPYLPILNLYDAALLLTLLFGLGVYLVSQQQSTPLHPNQPQPNLSRALANIQQKFTQRSGITATTMDSLLVSLGLIAFWVLSSMLVRTLHAYGGTPLWNGGAWNSEQVQTALTILWTLFALAATILASRYQKRLLWFMGIGLLAVVVLKLVLVDLSQTDAIWRVVSFIGAGSLILLIGYLAPLPPTQLHAKDEAAS